MKKGIYLILTVVVFFSCEDQIMPDLGTPTNQIVVDAFIDNRPGRHDIFVSRSQPYFENEFPTLLSGAEVYIEDLVTGARYDFIENEEAYSYNSPDTLGEIGNVYRLIVRVDGEVFQAFSTLNRVPPIDTIIYRFEQANAFIDDDFYLAEFVAVDPPGEGDTYWIKAYKNGQFLNKPNEINIAFDAGFSAGGAVDGLVFIQPIQDAINPFDTDENDEFIPPYDIGDSVFVELHSINITTFYFLQETITQTNRAGGFGALFAQPLANVPTNIENINPDSEERAVGFFNMSATSVMGLKLTEEIAEQAREQYFLEN
jgi:hypothetical protein